MNNEHRVGHVYKLVIVELECSKCRVDVFKFMNVDCRVVERRSQAFNWVGGIGGAKLPSFSEFTSKAQDRAHHR